MSGSKNINILKKNTIPSWNPENKPRKNKRSRLKISLDVKRERPPKKLVAGRTRCTPELILKFCELVTEGISASTICDYLGITGNAFHSWIRKGTEFNDSEDQEPQEYEIYGKFVRAYRKAAAKYLITRSRILHGTHDRNWYKEVVILERRDRKNWAKDAPQGGGDEQYQVDEKFI